jgi:hypothetical protein
VEIGDLPAGTRTVPLNTRYGTVIDFVTAGGRGAMGRGTTQPDQLKRRRNRTGKTVLGTTFSRK